MDSETSVSSRAGWPHTARTFQRGSPELVSARGVERSSGATRFDRRELKRILSTYFRMVVAGEWRDYAIDFRDDAAIFSVFRRASESPIYSIEKRPLLRDRQGQYCVIAPGGLVVGRGNDLAGVLHTLERKLFRSVRGEE
jgi:Protein of unknown function (DUF2794)